MNNDKKIEITEMWFAEAGGKCFYGIIKRSKDANGNPHLFSQINVNNGLIQACADDLKTLSKILDEMCVMYLNGLHEKFGEKLSVFHTNIFLN